MRKGLVVLVAAALVGSVIMVQTTAARSADENVLEF